MCKGKNVKVVDCRYCHGKGEILEGYDDMYGMVSTWMEDCSSCEGTGKLTVSDITCKCGTVFEGEEWQTECDTCYMETLLDQLEEDKSNGITH